VQEEFVTRLGEIGMWLAKNGDSIYGTRGGPIAPRPWGVTTTKGNKIYLHLLDWPDELLTIPRLPAPVIRTTLLASGKPVTTRDVEGGLLLRIPSAARDAFDTVLVLETRR
jgi:alpha-L-fucosidase